MNTILLMINVFSYLVDENHEILFFFNILDFGHSLSLYSRKSCSNEQVSKWKKNEILIFFFVA